MAAVDIEAEVEDFVDRLASEIYNQRAQSSREMTDERWANIKAKFPGSVRVCREDVHRLHADDIRAFRANLIANQNPTKETSC